MKRVASFALDVLMYGLAAYGAISIVMEWIA